MEERLRKDICNLDDHVSHEKSNPTTHYKTQIGDALGYACKFWAKHLIEVPNTSHGIEEVHKAINQFFTNNLLCWIGVLSLLEILDTDIFALNDVQQWYMLVSFM